MGTETSELSSLLRGISRPRAKRPGDGRPEATPAGASNPQKPAPKPAKVRIVGDGLSSTSKGGVETFTSLAENKSLRVPQWLARGAIACVGEGETLTEIQRHAIPAAIEGRDLLAVAPTGSGKTLAFLVPSVAIAVRAKKGEKTKALKRRRSSGASPSDGDGEDEVVAAGTNAVSKGPYAVLVSPTRELAAQTFRELRRLLSKTPKNKRLRALLLSNADSRLQDGGEDSGKREKGKRIRADIIVSTPPRLSQAIEAGLVRLSKTRMLILDEADKLFSDDKFLENVDAVMTACTHKRLRRCVYTATLPETAEELLRNVMQQPVRITVGERNAANSLVKQSLVFCGVEAEASKARGKGGKGTTYISGKLSAMRQLVTSGKLKPPVLVFVQSKDRATQLYEALRFDGMSIDVIHAGRTAKERARAVQNFRSGATWILITTDLMARGMDILGVNTVVNFDCPGVRSDYVHRVGRTGRAGHEGTCVTLYTEEDFGSLHMIASCMKTSGSEAPEWMLKLPRKHGGQAKKYVPPKRKNIMDNVGQAGKKQKKGNSRK